MPMRPPRGRLLRKGCITRNAPNAVEMVNFQLTRQVAPGPQRVSGRGVLEGVRGLGFALRPNATGVGLRHGGGRGSAAGDGRAAASRAFASRPPSAAAARWRWLSGIERRAGIAERRSAESA